MVRNSPVTKWSWRCSKRERISPTSPRSTPSGLIITRVLFTPGNLTVSTGVTRCHVQQLAAHFGDEIETARDDNEIIVGGTFSRVRECGHRVRMLEGHSAVSS